MAPDVIAAPDLRTRTRRAVEAEIASAAMGLFLDHGFEATTMEQIAREVGMSRRSLFRYFSTKEDIVLGSLVQIGLRVRDALEARPPAEPAWEALCAALVSQVEDPGHSPERDLRIAKLLYGTPSLRAGHLERLLRWQHLLTPGLAGRLDAPGDEAATLAARALAACLLACLDVATEAWARQDGVTELRDLFGRAVAAVGENAHRFSSAPTPAPTPTPAPAPRSPGDSL